MAWKKNIIWLLILTLIGLLIRPHALEPLPPAISENRGNAAHFPAFFLLTLLFFSLFPPQHTIRFRITATAAITIALALGTELIQSFTPGRTASGHDLIANFLAIFSALAGLWIWQTSRSAAFSWKKGLHLLISLVIASSLAQPYFLQVKAQMTSQRQFPLLSDFHQTGFALLWKTQNGTSSTLSQSLTPPRLDVTLPAKTSYPGINYLPGPQNWSPYQRLHLQVLNSSPAFLLGIRIDDDGDCSQQNSRFNGQHLLKSGENHLSFNLKSIQQSPKTRELNLAAIHRILLFTQENPQRQKFSIVKMWLE